ncbi:hypothetical protein KCU96_g2819, partial [Aureobasidium melanogenum]
TTQPVSFFYTRPLSQAPALNVTIQADFTPGYVFMSPYKSIKPAPYIYDKFGNLVWDGYGVTGSANAHNFRPCQYNGAPHLCFNQVNQQNGYGIGQSIIVDQNYKVVATAQTGGNVEPVDMHEFQLLNNGETAIVSSYQIVPFDLSYFNITTGLGWLSEGVFQEVNVTTGEVLFEWFSTNHVDPSASQITPNSTDTGGDGFGPQTAFDYFHINSIDKSTVSGNYLVSARHTSTLYYVNATSRDIIWQLSYLGQTDYSCSGFNFSFQHDARLLSENDTTTVLSIFDNASNGYTTTTSQSSGKVIAIDHNSGVATMLSNTTYPSDQGLLATSQGNTQLLSNGGFFHTWGNNPYLSEHSANGTAVFAAQFAAEDSAQNYRAFSADWESTPATTVPDVYAYAVNSSAPTRIYVSWNGCTTVSSWQFYGGASVGEDFAAIGNTTKQGFETFWEAEKFYQWQIVMSEPFSDKEKSNMDTALQSSRSAMPFIEEDDSIVTKTERDASPLFETEKTLKRSHSIERIIDTKRTKHSAEETPTTLDGPVSYSGGPVEPYVYPEKYDYERHESVPALVTTTQHHRRAEANLPRVLRGMIVPALAPHREQDDEMANFHKCFEENAKVPSVSPMWLALVGDPGEGKSTLFGNLSGVLGLSSTGKGSESLTQSPLDFFKSRNKETFVIVVNIRHQNGIKVRLRRCFQDLIKWASIAESEREIDDNEMVSSNAEAAQVHLSRLFPDRDEYGSLTDVEDMLRKRNLLSGGDYGPIVAELDNDVRSRILEESFDWKQLQKTMTAINAHDLQSKIRRYTDRGDLAPVVTSIQIGIHSSFLAQGIKISDLPGIQDTNTYTRQTALDGFERCPRVIIVGRMTRCLSKQNLEYYLKKAVREKGAGNVWLVLRDREEIPDEPDRANAAERNSIKQKREKVDKAIANGSSQEEVECLQKELRDEILTINDRVLTREFRKKYPDTRNTGSLNVVTISNIDYEKYLKGPCESNPPILDFDQTGIDLLRAQLCRAPSEAKAAALKRHITEMILMLKRLRLCFRTAQGPRRDAIISLFQTLARLTMKKYRDDLYASASSHKAGNRGLLKKSVVADIEMKIDGKWAKYTPGTIGAFFRKYGKHKHSVKGVAQKPEFWTEAILLLIERYVVDLEENLYNKVDECSAQILQDMTQKMDELKGETVNLDQIGAVNPVEIFEVWDKERELSEIFLISATTKLKENIRKTSIASMTDTGSTQGAFSMEMDSIYEGAITEIPTGTPQIGKKRLEYLKQKLFAYPGPFSKMADAVSDKLRERFEAWVEKVESRVNLTFQNSRDALLNEFKGKRMSATQRTKAASIIVPVINEALEILQADLDAYKQGDDE